MLGLALASACAPTAEYPPHRPSTKVALDVAYFVPVLGTWMTDGFSESLRTELAKYSIEVVAARSSSRPLAVITLGDWSDRAGFGRSINVELLLPNMGPKQVGRLRVPDLEMTTLDVAASPIAALIAKSIQAADSAAR
jgi:TolB-like protein